MSDKKCDGINCGGMHYGKHPTLCVACVNRAERAKRIQAFMDLEKTALDPSDLAKLQGLDLRAVLDLVEWAEHINAIGGDIFHCDEIGCGFCNNHDSLRKIISRLRGGKA